MSRLFALVVLLAALATAQKYDGPRPPKPDLLYIKHASTLAPTEDVIAAEQDKRSSEITYVIEGASSPVSTPLAAPMFLVQASKADPGETRTVQARCKERPSGSSSVVEEVEYRGASGSHTIRGRYLVEGRGGRQPRTGRVRAVSSRRRLQPRVLLPGAVGGRAGHGARLISWGL